VWPSETPIGQTRWSKALVRHGADAWEALAGVLGVVSVLETTVEEVDPLAAHNR
jgi:hypothetical protein